jgi:hypothetical protein
MLSARAHEPTDATQLSDVMREPPAAGAPEKVSGIANPV